MQFSEAVFRRIAELANENGMTLSQFAVRSGITPSTLYGMKSKKQTVPSLTSVKRLCDGLGIRLSYFFDADYIDLSDFE